MDLRNILSELRAELDSIDGAIESLERLQELRRGAQASGANAKGGRVDGESLTADSRSAAAHSLFE